MSQGVMQKNPLDFTWRGLYRLGAIGALVGGILTIADIMVYVIWPMPTTAMGYFELFHTNWIVGLLDLDFLGIIVYMLVLPMLLALYVSLRRASQSWMAIGTVLAFLAIAVYLASNTAGAMLSLSNQYWSSTTDAQRAADLAAGQAMLAIFQGPAFTTSWILISAALLTISVVMLRSGQFTKQTAVAGIIVNLTGLGETVLPGLTALVLALVNGVGLGLWFIVIGRVLLRQAREIPSSEKTAIDWPRRVERINV